MCLLIRHTPRPSRKRIGGTVRLQSAMEYLMTYGWAILIIAVVLGALFQLGVFNAGTFAPRAPPGACQVFRPNGPGSTNFINLEGVCSGELPQYVAWFDGTAGIAIRHGTTAQFGAGNPATFTAWINPSQISSINGAIFYRSLNCSEAGLRVVSGGYLWFDGCNSAPNTPFTISANSWSFVGYVLSGANVVVFAYPNNDLLAGYGTNPPPNDITIGDQCFQGNCLEAPFDGSIANVQLYNTSLSWAEIGAIYSEGIGGAPLVLQNLVGWWPLNGNANDYSGNNNNGVPSGVTYTSAWTSGYTTP